MSSASKRLLAIAGILVLLVSLVFVANSLEPTLASSMESSTANGTLEPDEDRAINGFTLALGFVMLGAWLLGELSARIGLPRVVG